MEGRNRKKERETRRDARLGGNFESFDGDTTVPNAAVQLVRSIHGWCARRVRGRTRSPTGWQGGKGTVEGADRGMPPRTAAAFCGGATVAAKPPSFSLSLSLSPSSCPAVSWSWPRAMHLLVCVSIRARIAYTRHAGRGSAFALV